MLYPTLLLLLAGKNWKGYGDPWGTQAISTVPFPLCEAEGYIGVMSSLPPSQTIVPEQEFVHSFNNYLTSSILVNRCHVPETLPGRYNGKQNRCGSRHQEACSPVRELTIG